MHKTHKGIVPIAVLILALLVLGGGTAYYAVKIERERQTPPGKAETQKPLDRTKKENESAKKAQITLVLNALNDSGQKGAAVLTDVEGTKTKVVVEVASGQAGKAQPAHIHLGSCPTPGAVAYPLKNVVNGRSETMLDIPLISLKEKLPLAVNVHKSAEEAKVYVACGDVPKDAFDGLNITTKAKGGAENAEETASKPKTYKIELTPAGYSQKELKIKKGDTVEFINRDTRTRWPASGPHPEHTTCPGFDAKPGIASGKSYSFTFNEAKTCPFHDHVVPNLFGKIIVE